MVEDYREKKELEDVTVSNFLGWGWVEYYEAEDAIIESYR